MIPLVKAMAHSDWNHGDKKNSLVATAVLDLDIEITGDDVMKLLEISDSQSIAVILNHIGKNSNQHFMDLAAAVDDLDEHGKELVMGLSCFLENKMMDPEE